MKVLLRLWEQLESTGATCVLDLSPDTNGDLVPLFHCTDPQGVGETLWPVAYGFIQLAQWMGA